MLPRQLPTNSTGATFWKVKRNGIDSDSETNNIAELTVTKLQKSSPSSKPATVPELNINALASSFDTFKPPRKKSAGGSSSPSQLQPLISSTSGSTLDGFFLLGVAKAEDPHQVTSAQLEGMGITRVVVEDLSLFIKLTYLDLSDNSVRFEDLASLPALKELRLACNGIKNIPPITSGFKELVMLDLSYNKLTMKSVSHLAALPKLKLLDLTYNELTSLPPNMEEFKQLEVLSLDQNKLKGESIKHLGASPNLRELDLSNNEISKIPLTTGFKSLEFLSLINNSIATEDDLESVWSCDKLSNVLIWGNPVRKTHLQNELGITFHTAQVSSSPTKSAIVTPEKLIKVDDPVTPRQKIPTYKSRLKPLTPLVLQEEEETSDEEDIIPMHTTYQVDHHVINDSSGFFLTQGEEVGEDQLVMKQKPGIYDALFEEDSDEESFQLPKGGIQAAVNALRLALKHPVTFSSKGQKPISFAATLSPTAKERLKSQRLKKLGSSPSSSPVPPPLNSAHEKSSPKNLTPDAEKPAMPPLGFLLTSVFMSEKPASLASKFGVQLNNKPRSAKSVNNSSTILNSNNTSNAVSPNVLKTSSDSQPTSPSLQNSTETPLEENGTETQSSEEDNNNTINYDQLETEYAESQVVSSVPSSQIGELLNEISDTPLASNTEDLRTSSYSEAEENQVVPNESQEESSKPEREEVSNNVEMEAV